MAPGAYQSSMVDKKNEPRWTIAGRYKDKINSLPGAGPGQYDIPSKLIESPGKTIG